MIIMQCLNFSLFVFCKGGLIRSLPEESDREQVWRNMATQPAANVETLGKLIQYRQSLAQQQGYSSYAHKFLKNKVTDCFAGLSLDSADSSLVLACGWMIQLLPPTPYHSTPGSEVSGSCDSHAGVVIDCSPSKGRERARAAVATEGIVAGALAWDVMEQGIWYGLRCIVSHPWCKGVL